VRITNVPSFLYKSDLEVECPDLGTLVIDVAYGGNFYAIVDTQKNFRDMADYTALDFIKWSPILRQRLNELYTFEHPENPAINRVSHLLWTGAPQHPEAHARNAVFYGEKAIDRSPCGTGTSSRMAQLFARGDLKVGDDFVHESIIGSLFNAKVEAEIIVAGYKAMIPSIGGWARMTGFNTIFIDDRDPFAHGFTVR
jgi:4-hydroxyproline epimerase